MTTPHLPTATYRLQFNNRFTFRDAAGLLDYLSNLGISDVYASPITVARPGSLHGYDVTDPTRINPELGTAEDFDAFLRALASRGMGLILDVVPNHMCATDSGNRWWQDVLERGPASPFATYFDVDFHPAKVDLNEKILLPILGDQFGRVLENGELQVAYHHGGFHARYWNQSLPLALDSWVRILEPALEELRISAMRDESEFQRLEDVLLRIRDHEGGYEDRKAAVSTRLQTLFQDGSAARAALDASLRTLNGAKGDPRSFDALESLLGEQPYRLSDWRVACDEVNYRRFFDINDLVAIRVEEPAVFRATHDLVAEILRKGGVTGLRVDHVDGLLEPIRYLESLRTMMKEAGAGESRILLIEKILDQRERLDPRWPVDGTTGYEFMNAVNDVFVEPRGLEALETFYERFTRRFDTPQETIYRSKRLILASSMAGELHVLTQRLDRISEQHRSSRDFTRKSLEAALAEVIACFPVYRTYADGEGPVSVDDQSIIEAAVLAARARNAATNESLFAFIQQVLLLQGPEGLTKEQMKERADFLLRFQQLTGPVMAKGLEDTACYRHYPLASLCEVGGGPDRRPASTAEFHEFNARRQARWNRSLSATTTHDTKRAEDVRARLNVLTEFPEEWKAAVQKWASLNEPFKRPLGTRRAPDLNEEYLIYQTLIATFPGTGTKAREEYLPRLRAYFTKALREARLHSSWMGPNTGYEAAVVGFVESILDPGHAFLSELTQWLDRIGEGALWNTLGQTLLKIASPGIPDIYQGSEFMDLRLADPDNRQPVDFNSRQRVSAELPPSPRPCALGELLGRHGGDAVKFLITQRALGARRRKAELFLRGDYVPLEVRGHRSGNVIAFARRHAGQEVVAVVGRFLARSAPEIRSGEFWAETELLLPKGSTYRDLLWSSPEHGVRDPELRDLLRPLPLALLERLS